MRVAVSYPEEREFMEEGVVESDSAVEDGADIFSRKSFLRRGAVVVGSVALLSPAAAQASALERLVSPGQGGPYVPGAFTSDEALTVEAVIERLIPSDASGPGAKEALVVRYIDWLLTTPMNLYHGVNNPQSNLRDAYAAGLQALDAYATANQGDRFVHLGPAQQDAVLTALQTNAATGFTPNSHTFFSLMRQHALEGMFADPYYGGNANFDGWNLIDFPGVKLSYTADEQKLDVSIKKSGKGTTQYALFGNDRKGM